MIDWVCYIKILFDEYVYEVVYYCECGVLQVEMVKSQNCSEGLIVWEICFVKVFSEEEFNQIE